MKKCILIGILILSCLVIGYVIYSNSYNTIPNTIVSEQQGYYTCPMHPDVRVEAPKGKRAFPPSENPSMPKDSSSEVIPDCPICGMHLVYVENATPPKKEVPEQQGYYTCPMHPDVRVEAPKGKRAFPPSENPSMPKDSSSEVIPDCPICGMHLVYVEAKIRNTTDTTVVASVQLRTQQVEHLRATLIPVQEKTLLKTIRVLARVIPSEQEESNIPTRIAGRIEKVYVNATGILVKQGEKLVDIYSPELITAGEEYLVAQKELQKTNNAIYANLAKQAKEKLLLFGILPKQLAEWTKKGSVPKNIPIYSSFSGIITKKYVVAGKYFQRGAVLYDVLNISSVWVQMSLYEHNMALAKIHQNVNVTFVPYPSQIWKTKIDFISSILSPETQTLELRATLANTNALLKPNMTGEAILEIPLEKSLVVPERALIRTGTRTIIWVAKSTTLYEAKEVQVGFTAKGFTQVFSGLQSGDMIVDEGAFLLDAQAQLFGGYSQ